MNIGRLILAVLFLIGAIACLVAAFLYGEGGRMGFAIVYSFSSLMFIGAATIQFYLAVND